jgi:stringent starvation protein B
MPSLLPPKKDVALALLERASVFVHLDPRKREVLVPSWLRQQPQLVLQVGLNMPVRIPDLAVSDEAVSCTLSFNRMPHFCSVPWSAIYALVGEDGRGMVWPEDIPAEVAAQAQSLGGRKPRLQSVSPAADDVGKRAAQARSAVFPEALPLESSSEDRAPSSSGTHPEVKVAEAGVAAVAMDALSGAVKSPSEQPRRSDSSDVSAGRSSRSSERPYLRLVR